MYDYKKEIIDTRRGCLGSSDGRLLAQIASLGCVPRSAYKRLAELKGLIEHQDIPTNDAMRFGDYIENAVFEHLHAQDSRWQSNIRLESKRYSRPNVKLISHPDFYKVDEEKKTIYVGECKATHYDVRLTRQTYVTQLYIHNVLAREKALQRGRTWIVVLYLCHYNTEDLDLAQEWSFDPSRLTVNRIKFNGPAFDIDAGMNIVSSFLDNFNEYYVGDDIDYHYLPATVQAQFDDVANTLAEIKEREAKVDEFKQRLYEFMREKDIKSIKNDAFSITRVDPSTSKSFDAKRYVADLQAKYPRKAKKIISEYTKEMSKKGYALIKIK